jgi:hypothetical protein
MPHIRLSHYVRLIARTDEVIQQTGAAVFEVDPRGRVPLFEEFSSVWLEPG